MEAIAEQFTQAIKEIGDAGTSVAGKGADAGKEFGTSNVAKGVEGGQKEQAETEKGDGGSAGSFKKPG